MKLNLFAATTAVFLIASSANANDIKFEYNQNNPTNSALAKSHTVKTEFTNSLAGNISYQVETVVTQADNKGAVSGQLSGKLTTSIPAGTFIAIKPRIEYGENFGTASKTGQFYGIEGKATVNVPVNGLSVSVGYRIRKGLGSVLGQNVNRAEVNTEYAIDKKYVLGLVYYKNTGDTQSNVIGAYTKVKF